MSLSIAFGSESFALALALGEEGTSFFVSSAILGKRTLFITISFPPPLSFRILFSRGSLLSLLMMMVTGIVLQVASYKTI